MTHAQRGLVPAALQRLDKAEIIRSRERIAELAHTTPVMTCQTFDREIGAELFFKCENFQRTGSFKLRGAANAVFSLTHEEGAKGVATFSSGNHGAAIALAARARGIRAFVVMPERATPVKRAAIEGYGATVIDCPGGPPEHERELARVIEKTGVIYIHPFNDARVIAGQATAAFELIHEVPNLDVLITPVGGGGLLSGTALAAAIFAPRIKIFAAEPDGANDAYRSLKAGKLIPVGNATTVADGLRTSLGSLTFPVIRRHVHKIICVSDTEILDAMRRIWERMKIVVEPSAAAALAALLKKSAVFAGKRVGVILSGGNVDLNLSGYGAPDPA